MRRVLANAALCLALGGVILTAPAQAWSRPSHMTTGAIAFDDLAQSDPDLIAALERIVAAHPHFDRLAKHAEGLEGAERTRVVLQWLARWPDDIRETELDQPEWHYELRVVYGSTWLWPFRNGDASEAFDLNFRILADDKASDADRAIALGWVMHIVGDIQQPLHAGHQLTWEFSESDRAGQIAFVRRSKGAEPTDLHEYWDGSLDQPGPDDATPKAWAGPLQAELPRESIKGLVYTGPVQEQFGHWLDESMILARIAAYKGTALQASADKSQAPVMTARENAFTRELSKRRVATAGYRIADVMRAALR